MSVRTKLAIRDGDSSKVEKFFTGLKKAYGAKWSWDKILEEPQQYTPLHVAAQCGKVEICKMFLENDCDINAKDIDGFDQHFLVKSSNCCLGGLLYIWLLQKGSFLFANFF